MMSVFYYFEYLSYTCAVPRGYTEGETWKILALSPYLTRNRGFLIIQLS